MPTRIRGNPSIYKLVYPADCHPITSSASDVGIWRPPQKQMEWNTVRTIFDDSFVMDCIWCDCYHFILLILLRLRQTDCDLALFWNHIEKVQTWACVWLPGQIWPDLGFLWNWAKLDWQSAPVSSTWANFGSWNGKSALDFGMSFITTLGWVQQSGMPDSGRRCSKPFADKGACLIVHSSHRTTDKTVKIVH